MARLGLAHGLVCEVRKASRRGIREEGAAGRGGGSAQVSLDFQPRAAPASPATCGWRQPEASVPWPPCRLDPDGAQGWERGRSPLPSWGFAPSTGMSSQGNQDTHSRTATLRVNVQMEGSRMPHYRFWRRPGFKSEGTSLNSAFLKQKADPTPPTSPARLPFPPILPCTQCPIPLSKLPQQP